MPSVLHHTSVHPIRNVGSHPIQQPASLPHNKNPEWHCQRQLACESDKDTLGESHTTVSVLPLSYSFAVSGHKASAGCYVPCFLPAFGIASLKAGTALFRHGFAVPPSPKGKAFYEMSASSRYLAPFSAMKFLYLSQ